MQGRWSPEGGTQQDAAASVLIRQGFPAEFWVERGEAGVMSVLWHAGLGCGGGQGTLHDRTVTVREWSAEIVFDGRRRATFEFVFEGQRQGVAIRYRRVSREKYPGCE